MRRSMNALELIAGLQIGKSVVMRASEQQVRGIADEIRRRGWSGPRMLRITEATDVKRMMGDVWSRVERVA
jgi:hypothetical protein